MVRAITITLLLFVTTMWSQVKIYEFETFDKRTPDGWKIEKMSGEIQIDDKEIILITPSFVFVYEITSKQQFIRVGSFIYSANDWRDEDIKIKIDKGDEYSKYLDFYYYSDEENMKYFRLCLTRCPYEK